MPPAADGKSSAAPRPCPLVADLDGTVIKSDLMQDAAAAFVARNPLNAFRLLKWMFAGRAHLKAQLAQHAPAPQAEHLPYNEEFIAYLRRAERPLILATAAHRRHADAVAAHLGLFDEVLATEGDINLKGRHKADALAARFGDGGFDYAGDSRADAAVWARAREKILVNAPAALARRYPQARQFDAPKPRLPVWRRALRPHHWAKNLLIFVAVIGNHQLLEAPAMASAALAFAVFCLLASATYLFNDVLDLAHDRRHDRKRHRPLAAGDISIFSSLAVSAALFIAGAALAATLPPPFWLAAGGYAALTFAYSFKLKRLLFLDVLTLALLFTLRILAGGAAGEIALTFWLLAFSVFIFLSLAILKRYTGLINAPESGRAYQAKDTPIIGVLGASAGMIAVFVLALYIDSDAVSGRYAHPQYVWLAVPLMIYWIARMWIFGGRGAIDGDPLLFAVRDRSSWIAGALLMLLIWLAI